MILYSLYRLAFLSTFMAVFTQLKYSIKKSVLILSSTMFIIWIVNSVIYKFTNIDFSNSIYPISVSVPAFICFFILSKSNVFKVLFSFLTVCNFGMLTSFIGLLAFFITGSFVVRIITEFVSIVLTLNLSLIVFKKPYFKILDTLDKGWGFLCSVPCFLSAIIYLLLYYPSEFYNRPESIPLILLVFSLMFAIYVVVYLNFENITQYYQLKQDKKFMLLHNNLQKKEYDAIMDKVNAIQIYRHDMRHHVNVVNAFLQDNNILEAQKYLSKINSNLIETVIERYCENYGVNVILSACIKKAKDKHIDVESTVHIPQNIKIDNMEIGSIFLNAMENAIIACEKIENPMNRKISIVCKENHSQLYIQISNTFVGQILFNGEYPVADNKDHGFGTRSIATIAEKHSGIFSFTAKNGIFKTTIILNY